MIRPEVWPWEIDAASGGCKIDPVAHHPHRPIPDPATGHLVADPDIVLKAKGFDLEISFFYSTASQPGGVMWGNRRSASVNMQIKIDQVNGNVNVIRGDGKVYGFSGIWAPSTPTSMTPNPTLYSGTELLWDGSQFIETFPDGKTVTYGEELQADTYYAVSEIEDLSGNVHAYTYDGINLIRIEVPGGNRVTFHYDGDGHVEMVQDWGDRRWLMTYDEFDQLETYTLPTGCQTQYFYPGDNGLVNAIMDPRGYVSSYTFNDFDRVETMSLGTATWTYTYYQYAGGPLGSRVESPTGAITTY